LLMAFKLITIFEQLFTRTAKGRMLPTIWLHCIAIGSERVKCGSQKVLKQSAEGGRRHFLAQFCENLESLHPPLEFSIA
jgi:hypothetical protein